MKFKKTFIICICMILFFEISAPLWGHLINLIAANRLKYDIVNIKNIDIVEIKTEHGHLVGNGNGMEYRCSALVKGNVDDFIINEVEHLRNKYYAVEIARPSGAKFDILHSNSPVTFENNEFNMSDGNGYYMIYIFDNTHVLPIGYRDWCGH